MDTRNPCAGAHQGPFSAGCGIDVWRCDHCGQRVTPTDARRTFAIKKRIVELEIATALASPES